MKMKKSYIAGVAKLLGVEEGEVFQVNDDGTIIVKGEREVEG